MKILETDKLILRIWHDEDLRSMFAINQDPKVMEYSPELQDLDKINAINNRGNTP